MLSRRSSVGNPNSLGSLKKLQLVLEAAKLEGDVAKLLSPFFVLYDLRVAYSHLTSDGTAEETFKRVADRLAIPHDAGLIETYTALRDQLLQCLRALTDLLKKAPPLTN